MSDPYELQRFLDAQDDHRTYERSVEELRRGRKTSHWMWFVFPQVAGLGMSPTSRRFALSGVDEARALLAHPVLGARLRECAQIVADADGVTAEEIFGSVDALKLCSSMTLFMRAAPEEPIFARVIERYFSGRADPETDRRL